MLIARYDIRTDEVQINDDHGRKCGYVDPYGLVGIVSELEGDNLLRVARDAPPGYRVSTTSDEYIYAAWDVVCFGGEEASC
jgi:hypothetical protein